LNEIGAIIALASESLVSAHSNAIATMGSMASKTSVCDAAKPKTTQAQAIEATAVLLPTSRIAQQQTLRASQPAD
jgi:hypothetical protein